MMKKWFLILFKVFLACILIAWLLQTGKLDLSLSSRLIKAPLYTGLTILLCMINIILPGIRLGLILKARSQQSFGVMKLAMINWVGMFFSSVLPGSVSGDLLKIFYIKRWDANFSHPFLLFAGFVDRLMGLMGLILILGFFSIFNYSSLVLLSPKLKLLLQFNFTLCLGVILSLVIFFIFPNIVEKIIKGRILNLWLDLRKIKLSLFKALGVSLVIQFISVVSFFLLTFSYYKTDLSFIQLLSFIPIGFISTAIPLAPGGLGVGHAVFQELFSFVGESEGANFFNLFFLVTIGFNILGFIPYLVFRQNINKKP